MHAEKKTINEHFSKKKTINEPFSNKSLGRGQYVS